MASGGRVARETVGRAAGDSSDYFVPHLRNNERVGARGGVRKRRAGRRTGEKTHRGEDRGRIARWEGRSPHESRPGEGPARYDGHAPCTSVKATETERRPKGSRGSARSRPETAATSGSGGAAREVRSSPSNARRARGVTARAFLRFSPRRGGDVTEGGAGKRTRRIEPSDAREARAFGAPKNAPRALREPVGKKGSTPARARPMSFNAISSTTISRDLSTVRHDEAQGDRTDRSTASVGSGGKE